MKDDSPQARRRAPLIFPRHVARRAVTLGCVAAAGPFAVLLMVMASGPLEPVSVGLAAVAAAIAVACVLLLASALRPLEKVAAEAARVAPPGCGEPADEAIVIARALDLLGRRLEAAMRRGDPALLDDPLTGLPNRLAVMRRGRDEITRARRKGEPLCAALFAIEDFGGFAATVGPAEADAATRVVAELAVQTLRAYDVVGRWDPTRFVAILPEAEIEHAVGALQRVRGVVAEADLGRRAGRAAAIAAGVAVLQPDDATLGDIVARAARALERAEARGGVEAAPGPRTRPAFLTSV
ncbi:MAG: GGDEF domain-containing protein [Rhodobacteraceae bacterium]|nr:MAG: GGDEF domain-containing protein [Paracoccaceae bacterium]